MSVSKSESKPEPRERQEFEISQSVVGALIGKGGARVRELSRLSGCFIQFEEGKMVAMGAPEKRAKAYEIAQSWIAGAFCLCACSAYVCAYTCMHVHTLIHIFVGRAKAYEIAQSWIAFVCMSCIYTPTCICTQA
jgi:hypothetical protein